MEVLEQIISRPQMSILDSTANINLFLSGTGGGKTHLGGIISYRFITEFSEVRGGIFANTFDQLNTSTLFRTREYWASIGVTEWSKDNPSGLYVSGKEPPANWVKCKRNFDRFNNIISFCNGGLIFTGSLDNYFSHSGKEFGWAILDETKDTKEEAVKEVIITRLRQSGMYRINGVMSKTGLPVHQWNPLYFLTSPAKVDWINEMFSLEKYIDEISSKIFSRETYFEKEFNDRFAVISSTYHNVDNVGENYINNILANNTEERGKALVFGHPFVQTGGEFYSSFSRIAHVDKIPYNPNISLHITFDQNSVPYNSASIWQVTKIEDMWLCDCIKEVCLANPHNSTQEVCEEIDRIYSNHTSGGFYYGDASGKNRTTMNKDFKHHYEIVASFLRRLWNNGSNRTCFSNPSVVMRRDFINTLFENKYPIRIRIDEDCKNMISDLMYLKQDIDGTKKKEIVNDKDTGDKYQKYGHMTDGMDYFLTELFNNYYLMFSNKYKQ